MSLVPVLLVWIGAMAVAGLAAAWFVVSRFSEVFFETRDWHTSSRARTIRWLILAGAVFFGCATVAGIVLMVAG